MTQLDLQPAPPTLRTPRRALSPHLRTLLSDHLVLIFTIAYFLAVWPFLSELTTSYNLANIRDSTLLLLAVAVGQTVVLITGGIDLSVTSIIAITSVAGAWIMSPKIGPLAGHPAAVPLAIVTMLVVGMLIGLLNGAAVTLLGMPAFIVTLTTMMFFSGLAIWITKSENIGYVPDSFCALWDGSILHIPCLLLIVASLALAVDLMLRRTLPGQWLCAVGMNAKASVVSGVPVRPVIIFAYVISGLCAAVGSMFYTARLATGSPTQGREILLDVIGATVIGGTSLYGGKGKILWTVYGVLLFTLIANTLDLWELKYPTVMIIKGAVILAAAAADILRNRILAGK